MEPILSLMASPFSSTVSKSSYFSNESKALQLRKCPRSTYREILLRPVAIHKRQSFLTPPSSSLSQSSDLLTIAFTSKYFSREAFGYAASHPLLNWTQELGRETVSDGSE